MATLAVPIADEETYREPQLRQGGLRRRAAGRCTSAAARSRTSATAAGLRPVDRRVPAAPRPVRLPPAFLLRPGQPAAEPLEQLEKLEQLRGPRRWAWTIQVGVVAHAGRGVDTPTDYERSSPSIPSCKRPADQAGLSAEMARRRGFRYSDGGA